MLRKGMDADEQRSGREALESLMSADLREMSTESDQIGQLFAASHDVRATDFRALLHIMVAETAGVPLTAAQLRQRMDVSPAAITYLVDRMIEAGHIRREADPGDRRKALLRYEKPGMALARSFFTPLGAEVRSAMTDLPDCDLAAAHRVFTALIEALSTFEAQQTAQDPKAAAVNGKRATPRGRRRVAP